MDEQIEAIEERLTKAETKAARATKALETAQKEVSDLKTALRVLREISDEENDASIKSPSQVVTNRQQQIIELLQIGAHNAISPADLHHTYTQASGDDLKIETLRTTMWRMKNDQKVFVTGGIPFRVESLDGKYFKQPSATYEAPKLTPVAPPPPGSFPTHNRFPPPQTTWPQSTPPVKSLPAPHRGKT